MLPPKHRGNSRMSLPHHPSLAQPANGAQQPGLPLQSPEVGPRTTPEEWVRIEKEYWADYKKAAQLEDQSMGEKYQHTTAPIKAKYTPLLERRVQLKKELDAIKTILDTMEDELTQIDMQYFEAKEIIEKRRVATRNHAMGVFSTYKEMAHRQAAGLGSEGERWQLQAAASEFATGNLAASQSGDTTSTDTSVDDHGGHGGGGADTPPSDGRGDSPHSSVSLRPIDNTDVTGVQVYGSNGSLIGDVKKINLANRHVRNILQIRPKRAVVVRQGRKFNKETMASIYEPSDVKGAKWLSCMIQATGEEQEIPCEPCRNKTGTWAGCVIVGGVDFPRCANCEWNRQGCVGSSYHQDRSQDVDLQEVAQSPFVFSEASAQASREGSFAHSFTPVNGAVLRRASATTPMRTSLPHARNPLPNMAPTPFYDRSFQGSVADDQADPGPEIINGSLHLEDNGEVFTAPLIMRDVPLERISSTHPYWDKNWEPVETSIREKLAEWEAKLVECLAAHPKKRFLAQRQVNRGRTILEFLEKGPIHPYQLVGKKWISKALISYDTLFRLAQVVDELPKFGVDVDPVAWLRERLHELHSEQGEAFSLSRTVHDLYRDPKLQFLRNRAGFGNIGRPCGVKKGMTSKYPGGIRPKDPRLPPPPRAKRSGQGLENKLATKRSRNDTRNASSSPQFKSEMASPSIPPVGGFDVEEGYTSTDTSGEGVSDLDFRILHLKTDTSQPDQKHTQYWHLVNDAENPFFEHEIMMGDENDDKWKVYPEPHNYHLFLHEIEKIKICPPDCLKIIIHTRVLGVIRPRGRIMVQFKRPRTMKRFLEVVNKLKKPIENVDRQFIEVEWERLEVPVIAIPPNQD